MHSQHFDWLLKPPQPPEGFFENKKQKRKGNSKLKKTCTWYKA